MNINKIYDFLQIAGAEFGAVDKQQLSLSLIEEEFNELIEANKTYDKEGIKDAIADLFVVIMNNAYYNGISTMEIEDMYDKVCISNMSKFCINQLEAQETVDAYLNGTHWDKPGIIIECTWEYANNYYIVRREDGKILKSINYKPVSELLLP